jgi:hypothetical protein
MNTQKEDIDGGTFLRTLFYWFCKPKCTTNDENGDTTLKTTLNHNHRGRNSATNHHKGSHDQIQITHE